MKILSTHIETWSGDLAMVGMAIGVICIGVFTWYIDRKQIDLTPLSIIWACIIFLLSGMFGMSFVGKQHVKYIEHKCTITNMEEFDNNKYEIVGQDGKLFITREVK